MNFRVRLQVSICRPPVMFIGDGVFAYFGFTCEREITIPFVPTEGLMLSFGLNESGDERQAFGPIRSVEWDDAAGAFICSEGSDEYAAETEDSTIRDMADDFESDGWTVDRTILNKFAAAATN